MAEIDVALTIVGALIGTGLAGLIFLFLGG